MAKRNKFKNKNELYSTFELTPQTVVHLRTSILKDLILSALNNVSIANLYSADSFDFFPEDVTLSQSGENSYFIHINIHPWHPINMKKIKKEIDEEIQQAIALTYRSYQIKTKIISVGGEK